LRTLTVSFGIGRCLGDDLDLGHHVRQGAGHDGSCIGDLTLDAVAEGGATVDLLVVDGDDDLVMAAREDGLREERLVVNAVLRGAWR